MKAPPCSTTRRSTDAADATVSEVGLLEPLQPLVRIAFEKNLFDQSLGTVTYPQRLQAEPERRRELLRQVLHGCLLILTDPSAPRARLYVFAEPGLIERP